MRPMQPTILRTRSGQRCSLGTLKPFPVQQANSSEPVIDMKLEKQRMSKILTPYLCLLTLTRHAKVNMHKHIKLMAMMALHLLFTIYLLPGCSCCYSVTAWKPSLSSSNFASVSIVGNSFYPPAISG